MHELSLAGGILKIVEDAAQREHFHRVSQLRLEVGALAGVDLQALQFALEAIRPGTPIEQAQIVFDTPPGTAWCMRCGCEQTIVSRGDACPQCQSYQLQAIGGTALRVVDMVVHDDG